MSREDMNARVLSASRAVFSRKGYRAATVQDIIDEAGIARATFYKYFTGKRQVFADLMGALLKVLDDTARDYMLTETDDPDLLIERISESLVLFYTLFLANRDVLSVYFSEAFLSDTGLYAIWDDFDRRVTEVFSKMIERGVKRGTFRTMNTDLAARTLLMLFLQVPYRDLLGSESTIIDIDLLATEMATFAVMGLTGGRNPAAHTG